MIKKVLHTILIVSLFTLLSSCQDKVETIVLPDLTGLNEQQALELLNEYDIEIVTVEVATNRVDVGLFISYQAPHSQGVTVESRTTITIVFATNRLPDLTGLNKSEILTALRDLRAILEFRVIETDDVDQGLFVEYEDLKQGDSINRGDSIVVYLAEPIFVINTGVMISKYLEGLDGNQAIELYNRTDKTIDLAGFSINLYQSGATTPGDIIQLEGVILPQETFLITNGQSAQELLNMADMTSNDLNFNGSGAVALVYQEIALVDVIGIIGRGTFLQNRLLTRDMSVLEPSEEFDFLSWNQFHHEHLVVFGQHPVEFPTAFTFNPEYLELDFTTRKGMIEVEFISNNDGDTAQFTQGFCGPNRVRFIGVDTPETGSGLVATLATNFVFNRLSNATTIHLQSHPSGQLTETYGRTLAFIWVDGVLLNYELVLRGFSQNNFFDQGLVFSGVTLETWMKNAERYAISKNLGVHA